MQIKSFQALDKTLHRDQKKQDHVYIIQPCKPVGPCQSLAEGADESARPRLNRSKTCKSRALRLLPNLAEGTESQQDHDYIIQDMQIKSSWALAKTLQRERMSQQDHVYIQRTCK